MQFLSNDSNLDNNNELMSERPIGWSSACLDSTIDFYLNCNFTELSEEKAEIEGFEKD